METKERVDSNPPRLLRSFHFFLFYLNHLSVSLSRVCAPTLPLTNMSTCHFNSVIQSVNTVIILLFCLLPVISIIYRYSALLFGYLPVLFYLPVLCSSAIPLSTWVVLVLLCVGPVCYYTLLVLIHNPNCC